MAGLLNICLCGGNIHPSNERRSALNWIAGNTLNYPLALFLMIEEQRRKILQAMDWHLQEVVESSVALLIKEGYTEDAAWDVTLSNTTEPDYETK